MPDFPGGMPGAQHLSECEKLMTILQHHYDQERTVCSNLCRTCFSIESFENKQKTPVTCYPGFEKYLPDFEVVADGVVVDGKMITGKGPGFAILFGLAILEQLRSASSWCEVAAGMLLV